MTFPHQPPIAIVTARSVLCLLLSIASPPLFTQQLSDTEILVESQRGPVTPIQMSFHPGDPNRFAVLDDGNRRISVWSHGDGFKRIVEIDANAISLALSPDGDLLASAGDNGIVRLWNPDGSPRTKPLVGHEGPIRGVAFSPDGQLVASAGWDRTVRLWNIDGTARGEALRGHEA